MEEETDVSNIVEYLEHREEAVAEVVASLAGVSRGEAKKRIWEAVAKAASLELDGPVRIEYNGITDALSLSCPAALGYAEASRRMSRVWDACWDHIRKWAGRLSKAA